MKTKLNSEIKKERCNAAALGMFNAGVDVSSERTDTSYVVKKEVEGLYQQQKDLEAKWKGKSGQIITNKQYDEQSAAIMRKIEALETKHGVHYKDQYLKASGYGDKKSVSKSRKTSRRVAGLSIKAEKASDSQMKLQRDAENASSPNRRNALLKFAKGKNDEFKKLNSKIKKLKK